MTNDDLTGAERWASVLDLVDRLKRDDPNIQNTHSALVARDVSVEEADANRVVRGRKVIEDWTLVHAIATPCARGNEHRHLSLKTSQQFLLRRGQPHLIMNRLPSTLVFIRCI